MISIHDTLPPDTQSRFGTQTRPLKRSMILPEADHRELQRHLQLCERERRPGRTFLAHVLHNKFMTTEPVSNLHARDLVTGGCRVTYSVNCAASQTGLLVHRARSGSGSGVIPVSSLLGATLLGMRVGQSAPLLCEDGAIMSVTVLDVTPPH